MYTLLKLAEGVYQYLAIRAELKKIESSVSVNKIFAAFYQEYSQNIKKPSFN